MSTANSHASKKQAYDLFNHAQQNEQSKLNSNVQGFTSSSNQVSDIIAESEFCIGKNTKQNVDRSPFRLIQQKPSWTLHAFLRFSDLKYVSEFTPSLTAIGRVLPVLIAGTNVTSETESLSYLAETVNGAHSFDLDSVLAKSLRSTIVEAFDQFTRESGDEKTRVFASAPIGLNAVLRGALHTQYAANMNKFDLLPNASSDDLVAYLDRQYSQLNAALTGREELALVNAISTLSGGSLQSSAGRGQADAVLFGHIAEALSNETLSSVVTKHNALMGFFSHVCNVYFATPYNTTTDSDDQSWTIALDLLLVNPYLKCVQCDRLKELLTSPAQSPIVIDLNAKKVSSGNGKDAPEWTVHSEASEYTTLGLSEQRFPVFVAAAEHTNVVLSNIQSLLGFKSAVAPSIKVVNQELSQEQARRVDVTLGGLVYLTVVTSSFVAYVL